MSTTDISSIGEMIEEIHYLEVVETCSSTMDLAKAYLESQRISGGLDLARLGRFAVFIAQHQSSGRGRHGRTWLSEDRGGLYLSILDLSQRNSRELGSLSLTIGLAIKDVLLSLDIPSFVKWPNDILTHEYKKLSGVLIEITQNTSSLLVHPIVGIGINVNQTEFPDSLSASSLRLVLGKELDKTAVLLRLIRSFLSRYDKHFSHGFSFFKEEYWSHSCMAGVMVALKENGEAHRVLRLNDDGSLQVLGSRGEISVYSGDVQVLI